MQYVTTATQTSSTDPSTAVFESPAAPKRDVETYNKAVQTEEWELPQAKKGADNEPHEDDKKPFAEREQSDIRARLRREVEEELRAALQIEHEDQPKREDMFPARVLSNEELDAVTGSEDFMVFIDQSTKVIERALDEPYDLLTDYAQGKLGVGDDEDGYRGRRGRRVKEVAQYFDERWSRKRMISDIGFSHKVGLPTIQVPPVVFADPGTRSTPNCSSRPTPRTLLPRMNQPG